ncbi:MAG: NAD-dependent epimerase/dehydratase family protein [Desulfomonile tiedjei]|nr:NAD-dependent epimerase/dehydratase family protein [Desulfomonile tiedjei]
MALNKGNKRILITGGAGFIGSHLVEGSLELGYQVRVLDNFSTGRRANLEGLGNARWKPNKDFELIEGDIRDMEAVHRATTGMDAVLHQAALGSVPRSVEDPITTQQVNADGTLNVFLAARDCSVSRVVYASSSSVYGDSEVLPKREGQEGLPLSPYALTKRVNEDYGRLFKGLYAFETVGLRYFNVYGPRQDPESDYAAVIPRFVKALVSGRQPVIFGTGEQSRDFTYVKDVVAANLLALDAPAEACGAGYNIGRGERTTLLELLRTLQELLGTQIEPRHDAPRPGDVMHSLADTSLAAKMLGFTAGHDLRQGLGESITWYRKNLA